jgi:hypothetical protein
MKELIIICEGPTEIEYCKKVLYWHLKQYNIKLKFILILHSNGGIVNWEILKKQIVKHYEDNNDVTISTFIDYYGLYESHGFVDWKLAEAEPLKSVRMTILENGMKNDLNPNIKFIPFILLHEFETLAFCDYDIFEKIYDSREAKFPKLKEICDDHPNPEDINNGLKTAPSKRLIKNIKRYKKTSDSINLTFQIGLTKIRTMCPGFNAWITTLENI